MICWSCCSSPYSLSWWPLFPSFWPSPWCLVIIIIAVVINPSPYQIRNISKQRDHWAIGDIGIHIANPDFAPFRQGRRSCYHLFCDRTWSIMTTVNVFFIGYTLQHLDERYQGVCYTIMIIVEICMCREYVKQNVKSEWSESTIYIKGNKITHKSQKLLWSFQLY